MAVEVVAHSYWCSIKQGVCTFESAPDLVKEDVYTLVWTDVVDGIIIQEEHQQYIGESYKPIDETA